MRAQVYSLVALMLAIPIFIFLTYYVTSIQTPSETAIIKVISDQVQSVESGMEEDFSRAVNIAGRRAMLTLMMEITNTGDYTENAGDLLMELMVNGSMDGNDTPIMYENTLPEWETRLLSIETGFSRDFQYQLFSVNQSVGFDLFANAHIIANVSEENVVIGREFTENFKIPLVDIEDPVYTIETGGKMVKTIKPYQYPYYVKELFDGPANSSCFGNATFDVGTPNANKILIVYNSTDISGFAGIVSSVGAPNQDCFISGIPDVVNLVNTSLETLGYPGLLIDEASSGLWSIPLRQGLENNNHFNNYGVGIIKRLEGNLTPETGGFISFVNTDDLALTGTVIKENQTTTDYLYFSDEIVNGNTVRGMPDWFRVEPATAVRFNITELVN